MSAAEKSDTPHIQSVLNTDHQQLNCKHTSRQKVQKLCLSVFTINQK